MTVQQLYDYAKKHDAVDYEIYGTSMCCGPYFDRVKVNAESKRLYTEDSSLGYSEDYYERGGFDLMPKNN